jgi:hypothetical protein
LNTPFYRQVGSAVFETCYAALQNCCDGKARILTASAPAGSGKTTFCVAFIAALTRLAKDCEGVPRSTGGGPLPFGCVLVVDQVNKADEKYHELNHLLPGQVAIWTKAHCSKRSPMDHKEYDLRDLSVSYSKDDLQRYPVVIVTHSMFGDKNGPKARNVLHQGRLQPRALTILDERPEDVELYPLTLAEVDDVRKDVLDLQEAAHAQAGDEHQHHYVSKLLYELASFMHNKAGEPLEPTTPGGGVELGGAKGKPKQLERPVHDPEAWAIIDRMAWFNTDEAVQYMGRHRHLPYIQAVFGFAQALANNRVFISRDMGGEGVTYFQGYKTNMVAQPGTVLLDASADIDGVTPLHPYRHTVEMPRATYSDLEIVHVPQFTKAKLKTFTSSPRTGKHMSHTFSTSSRSICSQGNVGLLYASKRYCLNSATT